MLDILSVIQKLVEVARNQWLNLVFMIFKFLLNSPNHSRFNLAAVPAIHALYNAWFTYEPVLYDRKNN